MNVIDVIVLMAVDFSIGTVAELGVGSGALRHSVA